MSSLGIFVLGVITGIILIITVNRLSEIAFETLEVRLQVVDKRKILGRIYIRDGREEFDDDSHYLILQYKNIEQAVAVSRMTYRITKIGDVVDGYYRVYRDYKGKKKIKLEVKNN